MGNGQKRELPVVSWPETGGQNYEGSKHSIWAHIIGQHRLPPVSGRTTTGTSRFLLLWSAPTRFGHIFLHFVAHQSSRSDQPGVERLQKYPAQMTGAGGKWEEGDLGSGHLGIPTAVNEAVTIRNLDKN